MTQETILELFSKGFTIGGMLSTATCVGAWAIRQIQILFKDILEHE